MAQAEVIKSLQKYIAILKKNGINIQKAFLFGSYARNEQRPDSDIDIMLVSEIYDSYDIKVKAKAWLYRKEVDLRIEPFTIGYNKFYSDNDSALVSAVKKEGIEIAI